MNRDCGWVCHSLYFQQQFPNPLHVYNIIIMSEDTHSRVYCVYTSTYPTFWSLQYTQEKDYGRSAACTNCTAFICATQAPIDHWNSSLKTFVPKVCLDLLKAVISHHIIWRDRLFLKSSQDKHGCYFM